MGHETAGQNFYLLPNKWFIYRENIQAKIKTIYIDAIHTETIYIGMIYIEESTLA